MNYELRTPNFEFDFDLTFISDFCYYINNMFGKPTSERGVKIPGPKMGSGAERIVVDKNPRQRLLEEISALNYQIDRAGRKSGDFRVAAQIQKLISKKARLTNEFIKLSNEEQPEDRGESSF